MEIHFKEYKFIFDKEYRVLVPEKMEKKRLYTCEISKDEKWAGNYEGIKTLMYACSVLGFEYTSDNIIIYLPFHEKEEDSLEYDLVLATNWGRFGENTWKKMKKLMKHVIPSKYIWRNSCINRRLGRMSQERRGDLMRDEKIKLEMLKKNTLFLVLDHFRFVDWSLALRDRLREREQACSENLISEEEIEYIITWKDIGWYLRWS